MRLHYTFFALLLLSCSVADAQFAIQYKDALENSVPAESLVVCLGSSLLTVRIDIATEKSVNNSVIIGFPAGVSYAAGSVLKIGGSDINPIEITESDISDLQAPKFTLSPDTLVSGAFIVFTVARQAGCAARTFALGSPPGIFKDVVTVNGLVNGEEKSESEDDPAINPYNVFFPSFSLTQPGAVNNTVVGGSYTRSFTITNGSLSSANAVHFSIFYEDEGIELNSITLQGVGTVTPTSIVDGTVFFSLSGTQLGADNLFSNGESLVFVESFKVKSCNATTYYQIGWGCSALPEDWCESTTGTGSITMLNQLAQLTQTTTHWKRTDYCSPDSLEVRISNSGPGAVFNIVTNLYHAQNGRNQFNALQFSFGSLYVNGVSVPVQPYIADPNNIARIDFSQLISDPDLTSFGLEDIDGDGSFDDLGANQFFTIAYTLQRNPVIDPVNCAEGEGHLVIQSDVRYTDQCWQNTTSTSKYNHFERVNQSRLRMFIGTIDLQNGLIGDYNFVISRDFLPDNAVSCQSNYTLTTVALPKGVTFIAGSARLNSSTVLNPAQAYQTGDTLYFVIAGKNVGDVTFKLSMSCSEIVTPGPAVLKLTSYYICNDGFSCSRISLYCQDHKIMLHCGSVCNTGGLTTVAASAKRTNLGFTDYHGTTLQSEAAVEPFWLKVATLKDSVEFNLKSVQRTDSVGSTFDNMHLSITYDEIDNGPVYLPVSGIVRIYDQSASEYYTFTLPSPVLSVLGTRRNIYYDMSSLLPQGMTLEDGDSVNVVTKNTISDHSYYTYLTMPTLTYVQPAFFNLRSNAQGSYDTITCGNSFTLEHYIHGRSTANISSYSDGAGCSSTIMQSTIRTHGLGAGYAWYPQEARAWYYVDSLVVIVNSGVKYIPGTATLNAEGWGTVNLGYPVTIPLPDPIISGKRMTWHNPGDWPLINKSYWGVGYLINYQVKSSCGAINTSDNTTYYIKEYYNTHNPSAYLTTTRGSNAPKVITNPTLILSNLTGEIQASQPSHYWDVRISNPTPYSAPNVWLAIPENETINITSVVSLPSGTDIPAISYSGGKWYKLPDIEGGRDTALRITFTYTSCNSESLKILTGWDCIGYPSDPTTYPCAPKELDLKFTPVASAVEIMKVSAPDGPVELCKPISYHYKVNSSQAANTIQNTFSIEVRQGMWVIEGSFQAEYPAGSDDWDTVPFSWSLSENKYTYYLDSLSNFPVNGLPGTLNDGGDTTKRQIGVRWEIQTDCEFIVGSNFIVSTEAFRPCGQIADGSNIPLQGPAVYVIGVINPYLTVFNELTAINPLEKCSNISTLKINTTTAAGTTGDNDRIFIDLPAGISYISGSLDCTTDNCPGFENITVNEDGGERVILVIPPDMGPGTIMDYSIGIEDDLLVDCGFQTVEVYAVVYIADVPCVTEPFGTCSLTISQTGSETTDIGISRTELSFINPTVCLDMINAPAYYSYNLAGSILVSDYDVEAGQSILLSVCCPSNPAEPIGYYQISGPLAIGDEATYNFSVPAICVSDQTLIFRLNKSQNCICETVEVTVPVLILETQSGQLSACPVDEEGSVAEFNLPDADALVDPAGINTVSYYDSYSNALQSIHALTSPYLSETITIWARIETASGCAQIEIVQLVVLENPVILISGTETICSPSEGEATVSVLSGPTPHSFLWSNAMTTQTITGLSAGTYMVTVTDGNGCTKEGSITLYDDDKDPVFINCPEGQIFTVGANANCEAGIIWGIPVAVDNCGIVDLSETSVGGPFYGTQLLPGTYEIVYTASDPYGNSAECSFTVIVTDDSNPLLVCPPDFTIPTDPGMCSWSSEDNQLNPLFAADNCPEQELSYLISGETNGSGIGTVPSTEFNFGVSTVKYTLTDGMNTVSCSFTVNVVDMQAPVLSCPTSVALSTDQGECFTSLTPALLDSHVTDNCTGFDDLGINYRVFNPDNSVSGLQSNGDAYNFVPGVSQIEWIVSDLAGNVITCLQQVTISDNQIPVILCTTGSFEFESTPGECGYLVTDSSLDVTVSDNCDVVMLTHDFYSWGNPETLEGAVLPVGTTVVTWTAVDLNGNMANCQISVLVTDNEAPQFVNCPTGQTITVSLFPGTCEGGANWSIPFAVDNCGFVTVSQTSGPAYGSAIGVGTHTITYTATDATGLSSACTFYIEVVDTEGPVIVCPGNIMVSTTDPEVCHWASPEGSLTPLMVNSNCPAEVTWDVVFPLDLSQQNIVLAGWNFENPLKRVSPHLPYTADDGIVLNKDIAAISLSGGSTFSTWVNGTGGSGTSAANSKNWADGAYSKYWLLQINTEGFEDISLSSKMQGSDLGPKSWQVEYSLDGSTWLMVPLSSYTITNSSAFPLSGQLLNLPLPADLDNQPVAYLRWLMTENVSINNSTVTNDGTNRIDDIAVKGNFMVSSIHGADDASGVVFPLGTSFVTYTITESSGDQSWSCDFTVTVEDTQNPVIICPPPLFAYIDEDNCSTQLTLSLPFVSDNCNGPLVITYRVFNPDNSISQTYSGTQLNYTFIQGYSQIEWTVTDAAGNTDLCLQQVTIAELLPTVSAGENQVICSNQAFTISGATATNYSSIEWTTFGTGEFISGQGTLTPTYTLSAGDISAGQVVIGVTATGGCRSVSDEMVLTVWKQPEVDAGPDLSICFGENAVLTGATATDYHFLSWTSSGNGTFNYPQALNPTYTPAVGEFGAFTLTLTAIPTAGTTCIEAVSTMNLFIHSEITLNANITSNTQCNAAIGEVVLTGSEDGMVTLNGVNKPSPAIFTGLAAGYYTAYFTVANGCFVGRSFNIINVNSTLAATVEVLDPGCYGGTVTATITASGGSGVGTYIYLLNGTVSNSTGVFPGLGQGNYNVLVTDENGCTFSVAFEVDQPAQLVVQIISITNTSCDESSTGAATVNASGGTPPYYYLWNDPGAQNNLTATGLSVGNYQVTVTDANGCTASTTVFISSEGSLAINPVDDFGPFCQGELVQPIFLSTTPVNPAVVYSWTGGVDIGLPDGYASGLYPVIPSFVAADDFITREITIVAVLDDCIATTSFSVTISDTEPPLFLNCPSGETFTVGLFPGECVGSSMWSIPVAVDNCSAVIVVETSVGGPYYGAELTAGIYTITYTASDGAGNIASCTFFIEITDTEEPIIVCPGNTMVSQTDPDECHWASPAGSLTPLFVNSNCPAEVTWNVVFPLDLSQQNIVLAGWNFENPLKRVSPHLPYTADDGIVLNKDIAAISLSGGSTFSTWVNGTGGSGTSAANSKNWADGAYSKYWLLQINTEGFEDISLSSKMQGSDLGPKSWQVEYSLDGSTWLMVPLSSYTITNSSAFPLSGQLLNLPLPADLDNQPVAYLRWLMTENVSINNSMVTNDGTNRIDDIFIKGNYFATSINGSNDASGVVFPLGTSVVTYTITETVSDQYSVCDFTVTVEDEQTPEITCPSSVFQSADVGLCSANISLELPIVSDNCTLSPTISYNVFNPDNSSSGPFPSSLNEYDFLVGNSLVEWIVTDASSNTINCFQQVIINEILPYADAGSDAAMCSSQGSHVIAGAFASNYVSLYWSTSGTGSFSAGQGTLTPSYTLSDGDILSGQIVLTLTASGGCSVASDFMVLTIWKEASVYAGPDAAIAAGQNYTLSGATAGNYSSLHWTSTGTGFFNNPAAVNPTYIPSEADIVTGSIDLMIEATGFGVCATISDVMTLTIHPNPIVNAGSDAEICTTDGSYFIENAQAFNYTTVQWTTSGTGTFINAGAIKPTYVPSLSDKNTGQVLLTMAATGNGGSDSDFMVLSIFPPPTANAGSNAVVCQGDSFTVVESSATQYSDLSWSHNGSGELTNYTTLSPTYIPAPTETGPVLLTLTANGHGTCAAAVDEFVLTIAPSPVSNAGDGQDLCNQVLFVLSGNVVPNSTVKWTLEAGPNTPAIFDSDKPNALVVGAIPGVYTFVYTVTLGSCKDSDKVRIANWENVICCVNAGPDISVCDVTSVAMNAGSPIVGIGTWSQMSGPNTAVIDDPVNSQSTMYGLIPGTYIFRWTNTNGPACSVIYDDMMLTVANPAMAYAGQDMTICQNQSYQLDHATASNYISLLWSTSGTGFFSNRYALNPVYTPSASDKLNGIVQLTLTAYSSAPCSPAIRSMLLTLQAPASLEAVNDILGPVNGYEGSLNAGVATENDLRNGLPVEASQIIASLVTPATPLMPGSPVPAFDPVTGIVSVIPQTPSGIYSISYRICENICPENCSQATIFIQVISAEIVANNDNFTMSPVNGYIGGFVSGSILANDVLNSVAVNVDEINVELTDDGGMTGVVLNESNQVVIPASTPAGVYTLTYKICEILNPANCDDALIFVLVNPPPIVANDDDFIANQINGFTGGVAGSLLPNDLLNGIIALQSEVMIGIVSDGGLTGIATDIDGNLVVPGFVASGTYTVTYKLCEILNPDNCDMADAIVRVISPDIIANDDDFIASPVNGNHGGTSGNVLANDYLNGNLVHQDDILISIVNDGGLTGLFIGTDGWVDVPAGTSAGIYTATYSICDLINPTNCDEATITVKVYTPLIALRKLATTSNYGSAGEMITYTISVENSGAVEISDLAVEDVLATNGPVYVSGDEGASGILDVGEIWIYSATYTIKQSDVDAGTFTNTAIVTGNDPNGNPLSAEDTETVVAIINPEVAITKACTTIPNFYIAVDDELTYTISIENTGNVTLYDVLVTDHQTGLNQTFSILSPGELINLNTSYYVSQADIDAGKFDNTATVSATFTAGNAAPQFLLDNDSETVFAEQQPGIFVTKASTKVPNSYSQPEEELTYNISVTNTGNVTLNNVLVIDPLTGLSQSIASLAPQSSQSFNTSYTVGQADLDAGQVDNMANATGFYYDVNGLQLSVTCNDTETVYSNQISAIGLIKTASYDQNTGLIIYTYSVTNTGNVTLYDIEVYEQESSFTGSGILPVPLFFAGGSYLGGNGVLRDIAPGQRIIFRASYSVEQADIDEGFVSNQAQTSGFTSNGAVIADLSDFTSNLMDRPTVVIFEHYPEITLTKVADPMIYNEINQEISYTITVKNEGNVTLSNIIAEDPMLGLVTNIFTLAPNAEVTFMNSYFITMDDLIEGNIVNTATVEGNDPRSNAVYAVDEVTIVALFSEIIANDDDFGTIGDPGKSTEAGNVLDNDYFKGVKVERDMVSLEVVSAASDPGVYIDITTGNLNVQTGVPSGSYAIEYRICEIGNPANCDNAIATIEVLRQCIEISSWVYLEGAAVDPCGLLDYTFPMRTDLNDLRLLPGQTFEDVFFGTHYTPAGQPYNVAPWFYNGTEGDGYDSHGDPLHGNANYPSTVVDWILVSLRNDPEGTGGPVCQAAALLHNNGAIEFITGHFTCCNPGLNSEFWLVIEHRNHMIVMSEEVIGIVGGKITYDFRDKQTYVNDPFGYGIFARQKEVLTGTFAMFAGNGEQFIKTEADTDITFDDRRFWQGQNGIFGHYRIGDYNLNGDVNFNDRTLWEFNNGRFTSVVRD